MSSTHIDIHASLGGFRIDARFDIPAQGIVALLGQTGSGKTSILRCLAGLLEPEQGTIWHGNTLWYDSARRVHVAPQRRNIGMVFQDYALFPHLTVERNIAYGLPRHIAAARTAQWVECLHLQKFVQRYPHQLSGGQRQRVAIARALAREPGLLLLDEPFSALDQGCRQFLRRELPRIINAANCPVLMVTHSIGDARYLADRIAILKQGRLLEMAPTEELFRQPRSVTVARSLGWKNFLVVDDLEGNQATGAWGVLQLPGPVEARTDTPGYALSIRPEHIEIGRQSANSLRASIQRVTDLGATRNVECRLQNGAYIQVSIPWNELIAAPGSQVSLHLPAQHLHVLQQDGFSGNGRRQTDADLDSADAWDDDLDMGMHN